MSIVVIELVVVEILPFDFKSQLFAVKSVRKGLRQLWSRVYLHEQNGIALAWTKKFKLRRNKEEVYNWNYFFFNAALATQSKIKATSSHGPPPQTTNGHCFGMRLPRQCSTDNEDGKRAHPPSPLFIMHVHFRKLFNSFKNQVGILAPLAKATMQPQKAYERGLSKCDQNYERLSEKVYQCCGIDNRRPPSLLHFAQHFLHGLHPSSERCDVERCKPVLKQKKGLRGEHLISNHSYQYSLHGALGSTLL